MSKTRVENDADLTYATIDTLARGGIKDIFNAELQKVLDNILDINTEAEVKRAVQITVEILPSETRDEGDVVIKAKSKFAPFRGATSRILIGKRRGSAVATVNDPKALQDKWDEESQPRAITSKSTGS